MIRAACLAVLVWAGQALADLPIGDFERAETPFGVFAIARDVGQFREDRLIFNGQWTGIEDFQLRIKGAYAYPGEAQVWVLVETMHNGNMCPYGLILLKVSAAGIARTELFGDCLGQIEQVAVTPGQIAVRVVDPDLTVAAQLFVFDGATLSQTALAADIAPAPVPGGGADVARWLGGHTSEVFHDAGEQARFGQIMSLAEFDELRVVSSVAGSTVQVGGWVIGQGCQPHACNAARGLWAIRIADGAPVAVISQQGGGTRWFGSPQVLADPVLRGYVAANLW